MKRALVRIAALAAVLVVGFFVVAGVRRWLHGAGEQVAQAADGVASQADPGRVPAADPAASPEVPHTLPFNSRVNPIRTGSGAVGVNPVRATAAADDRSAEPVPVRRLDVTAPSVAPTSLDPLGLRATERPNDPSPKGTVDLGWPAAVAADDFPPHRPPGHCKSTSMQTPAHGPRRPARSPARSSGNGPRPSRPC